MSKKKVYLWVNRVRFQGKLYPKEEIKRKKKNCLNAHNCDHDSSAFQWIKHIVMNMRCFIKGCKKQNIFLWDLLEPLTKRMFHHTMFVQWYKTSKFADFEKSTNFEFNGTFSVLWMGAFYDISVKKELVSRFP